MRNLKKFGLLIITTSLVFISCGRKDKGDGGDDDDGPGAEGPADGATEQDNGSEAVPAFDLAVGCTGEEVVSTLLNATGYKLSSLTQQQQAAILLSQSRLPGERSLELSTSAHITNKLNLSAEIGVIFAAAWSGDKTSKAYATIKAKYGEFPAGNRLASIIFGKKFYEQVNGGTADGVTVSAMGDLLDSLDESTTNPKDGTGVAPVDDKGKVVALVTAIGSAMCMN